MDPEGLSKTEGGYKSGSTGDEYYHRLKEANGNRPKIDAIENEVKAKRREGKIKGNRWKNIKAWIKTAKDGRLYIKFPIVLFEFQETLLEYPPGMSIDMIEYLEDTDPCSD